MQGRGAMMVVPEDVSWRKDGDAWPTPMIVQQFVDSARGEEVRAWFVHGQLMATCARRFSSSQSAGRCHDGGIACPATVNSHLPTADEAALFADVAAVLDRCGVSMAAVDFIEGLAVDLNIVSPGLVVEMETHHPRLAERIVQPLVAFARER
jgi:glutathione synthase/RimK-type ligase-like ATP-grasp enzyme